ncbi:NAD-dependent epimerase/dehydratase family protein [Rhodococcus opacus]|uniref:Putative nucleotide-sugar epimerase n=1 Tax=Rhodococcus opacus (strain B4) TaxID=632772 RepID=C1BED8_RHOOB|nr:NAD-dependent epimerase/dehydratase family protein [Rhodococcus opacus]BAH56178.1 putative nucleotide-sugar epimerase [Rhodococcus opacus B4]
MVALITGVAGFIGSTLARRLISEGIEVRGVDSLTDYYDPDLKKSNLASIPKSRFEFVEGDLNTLELSDLLRGVEFVFHQAGQPGVRKSWGSEFDLYALDNVQATQRLLEAVKTDGSRIKKLVYASSSSVYGNALQYPTVESDTPRPLSPYGVTKLAAEHLCSLYGENFGIPTVSLRYFTVYGPGQRPDMAFTRFFRAVLQGDSIEVYGTGDQIRDFTYIDDIVEANIAAAFSDVPPASVYNVAGGSSVSLNETIKIIGDITKRPVEISSGGTVAGDVFRTGGSTAKISSELGWSPIVPIDDGLEKQYQWARDVFGEGPLT